MAVRRCPVIMPSCPAFTPCLNTVGEFMSDCAIGVVSTSRQMTQRVLDVATALNLSLVYVQSFLDNAILPSLRMIQKNNLDVLVSLRGTAAQLRDSTNVPVIGIPTLAMDILNVIEEAHKNEKNFMLTVYDEQQIDIEFLEKTFGTKIRVGRYRNLSELEELIRDVCRTDCTAVVGGGATARLAKKYGLSNYLMVPSRNTIALSLNHALRMAREKHAQKVLLAQQRGILDAVSEGIVAVDQEGHITFFNKQAQRIFQVPENVVGRLVGEILPNSPLPEVMESGTPRLSEIESIRDASFVVSSLPIALPGKGIVGGVTTLIPSNKTASKNTKSAQASQGLVAKYKLENYRHTSAVMARTIEKARQFAVTESTVLLTGETGTGKEIMAHGIHLASARRRGPFVSVNCSALPETLLESELFGYESGAFTGSRREGKRGLFELADGGTLFLDEINSIPVSVQNVLLRALQEKEIRRVGGYDLLPVNVRVIAATNRNLVDEVHAGRLREDLYFRLCVLTIDLPPLRQRREDIPVLVETFLHSMAVRYHTPLLTLPPDCLQRLSALAWPGNARELKHFVERLVILSPASGFDRNIFEELYAELCASSQKLLHVMNPDLAEPSPPVDDTAQPADGLLTKSRLEDALYRCGWHKARTAQLLGISRTTLWRAMTRFDVTRPSGTY